MWSDDSSNGLIAANPGRGSGQKITSSADGGFFIRWLNPDDGFSLYLQRLDSMGNLQLPLSSPGTEGILVYQRNEQYSTTVF